MMDDGYEKAGVMDDGYEKTGMMMDVRKPA